MIVQLRSFRLGVVASTQFLTSILFLCAVATTALGQAPAGSSWEHLKALPADTRLHVSADKGGGTCKLITIDDATLACGKKTFQRADVKSIKLTRYGVSYGAAAGIGAGVGIGVGIALTGDKNSLFVHDKGEFAGIGAAIGAGIGALITGPADLFRGPTVYRRP